MTDLVARTVVTADVAPTVHHRSDVALLQRNAEVDWESFDPDAYWELNYRSLRNDDQAIIQTVGEFFSRHFRNSPQMHALRALDVGSGGNLYPALAVLPWSGTLTLTDPAAVNVDWLRAAAGPGADDARGRWVWQPFWAEYARNPGYQQLLDPRAELAARFEVRQQGVLELERTGWDLGTLFFVAESITSYPDEFEHAVLAFTRALVPGAPFAAAFMDSPVGYQVAGRPYPSVRAVDVPLVQAVLSRLSGDVTVARIDVTAHDPERDGYQGMIVATGTKA